MGFSQGAKKDKPGIKFVPESGLRSATSWPILVSVNSLGTSVQGVLGVSGESWRSWRVH